MSRSASSSGSRPLAAEQLGQFQRHVPRLLGARESAPSRLDADLQERGIARELREIDLLPGVAVAVHPALRVPRGRVLPAAPPARARRGCAGRARAARRCRRSARRRAARTARAASGRAGGDRLAAEESRRSRSRCTGCRGCSRRRETTARVSGTGHDRRHRDHLAGVGEPDQPALAAAATARAATIRPARSSWSASRAASSCWNVRRSRRAARAMAWRSGDRSSADRGDLREQLVACPPASRCSRARPGACPRSCRSPGSSTCTG